VKAFFTKYIKKTYPCKNFLIIFKREKEAEAVSGFFAVQKLISRQRIAYG